MRSLTAWVESGAAFLALALLWGLLSLIYALTTALAAAARDWRAGRRARREVHL